jgi:hypothetical protein
VYCPLADIDDYWGIGMSSLEHELSQCEIQIGEAQKAAERLLKNIRQVRHAAKIGNVIDLEKSLRSLSETTRDALARASSLDSSWEFNAPAYLARGGYAAELLAEAEQVGVELFEKDGRIYCFPLLLKIEPKELAVRIGTKLERRIRPKEVVRQLLAFQQRRQRFTEPQFLQLLYRTYQRLTGREWTDLRQGLGPVVPVVDLHSVLTLMPGTAYPIEEFGRDLLLLDRQPELRTRDNMAFKFLGSTMSRERVKRVTVYDEKGSERTYLGIAFLRGT